MQGYSKETGVLYIKNLGFAYNLCLHKPLTVITGHSGVGKTFLYEILSSRVQQHVKDNSAYPEVDNIRVYNRVNFTDDFWKCRDCLIVLDDADMLLDGNEGVLDRIRNDCSNHYLIFARKGFNLGVTPAYYGFFVVEGDEVRIKYPFWR